MSTFPDITFETKCYENDWEFILKGNYLKKMIERCGTNFKNRQLIINNIKNRELVESFAKKKVMDRIIDVYYFAEDFADAALSSAGLSQEDFTGGGMNIQYLNLLASISVKQNIYFIFQVMPSPQKAGRKQNGLKRPRKKCN